VAIDQLECESKGLRRVSLDEVTEILGVKRVSVVRWRENCLSQLDDLVSQERPIALEFNGISHAVMLATPCDLKDFALGFGICEGILSGAADLYGCDISQSDLGTTVSLEISSRSFDFLKQRRRSMVGRTGCGICGTESLAQMVRPLPAAPQHVSIHAKAILHAIQSMRDGQVLNRLTGSLHAAAWCDSHGSVQVIREDVGRHNALDKVVGALAISRMPVASGFIAVTSRASVEMVQKAACAGVSIMAAVSAPTQMAIETALKAGITLVGLVRQNDLVIYTHPEHVVFSTKSFHDLIQVNPNCEISTPVTDPGAGLTGPNSVGH
jgi:FdhD protein